MTKTVDSHRIQYTPSTFARSSLLHLSETGSLTALQPHTSARENLGGYLLLVVEAGCGVVKVGRKEYEMKSGDVAFIDCSKPYSHSTPGNIQSATTLKSAKTIIKNIGSGVGNHTEAAEEEENGGVEDSGLWTISWCHFNGPSLALVYSKFLERSGRRPTFSSSSIAPLVHQLYSVASSSSYIRDMQINTLLSSVLERVMEDCWNEEEYAPGRAAVDLTAVKDYIEKHYADHITLENLSATFFVEKTYLSRAFKLQFGINLFDYLHLIRINKVKELLRFGDNGRIMKLAEIAEVTGFGSESYLSLRFKKTEGISPSEYREKWK